MEIMRNFEDVWADCLVKKFSVAMMTQNSYPF